MNYNPGLPRASGRRPSQAPLSAGPPVWRILTQGAGAGGGSGDSLEAVKRDILANLGTILNSRRGRCMGHPDFGIPDMSEFFVSRKGLASLGLEIKRTIERWEPRIARPVDVRFAHLPQEGPEAAEGVFRATFVIRARLAAPWDQPCAFRTTVSAGGQTEVEG